MLYYCSFSRTPITTIHKVSPQLFSFNGSFPNTGLSSSLNQIQHYEDHELSLEGERKSQGQESYNNIFSPAFPPTPALPPPYAHTLSHFLGVFWRSIVENPFTLGYFYFYQHSCLEAFVHKFLLRNFILYLKETDFQLCS